MSDVALTRFTAGWRDLLDAVSVRTSMRLTPSDGGDDPELPEPDLVVDVVRAADLLSVTVLGYGVELVEGADAHLRPIEDTEDARLVYRFAFQHLGEEAIYEAPAPEPDPSDPTEEPPKPNPGDPAADPNAIHVAPIQGALPARSSRIALSVPQGASIPFTTVGLLDALEQFPMVVHERATPRVPKPPKGVSVGPQLHLPGDMVAEFQGNQLAISAAPAGTAPDMTTVRGLVTVARDTRRLNEILTRNSTVSLASEMDAESVATATTAIGRYRPYPSPVIERFRYRLPRHSSEPTATETAIEAPFRLIVSPSELNGWTHAREPVVAEDAAHRIELWHSRLGVRHESDEDHEDAPVVIDERSDVQRIVRAVWARDREAFPEWATHPPGLGDDVGPFRMSLNSADRDILVRQSAEWWVAKPGTSLIEPEPVDAEKLYLSALGAWLDLHGEWETAPYSEQKWPSILSWDHVAPMGRDQYVRVVYPGYLFPFGHRCTLVKVTERKMRPASPSVAGLYQRKFLVVGERLKTYAHDKDPDPHPFAEVAVSPLITPNLLPDPDDGLDGHSDLLYFIPNVSGERFNFVLHCVDQEGRKVKLTTPLVWVAEWYAEEALGTEPKVEDFYATSGINRIDARSQDVAFAPPSASGDTTLPTEILEFRGAPHSPHLGTAKPSLVSATARVPAVENLSPVGSVTIEYPDIYRTNKFGNGNAADVWAQVVGAPEMRFGGDVGSDKAGGFLQPDLKVEGLSRVQGAIGDIASAANGSFADAGKILGSALPKLFGIVELKELLNLGDLGVAPKVVSEALDRIEGFLADLEATRQTLQLAVEETAGNVQSQAQDVLDQFEAVKDSIVNAVQQVVAGATDAATALQDPRTDLVSAVGGLRGLAPELPPLLRDRVNRLTSILEDVTATANEFFDEVDRFATGLAQAAEGRYRYEWHPKVKSWPNESQPFLKLGENALTVVVEGRLRGKGTPSVEVLAELRKFSLILFNVKPMAKFSFEHLSFKSGSSIKTEVDVVFDDIEFVGVLTFVQKLRELIPFDGFSDPPYVDVAPEGLEAGFTLALPNVSIGVFNLSNISLGADVQVPFLGQVVTVGFHFCTRERPFNLSIVMLGGGGWFLLRLAPDGLVVLELGLEAAATLSVDLGVASGSVSASLGVYIRLEGDEGSLTAYFRLRGRVSVLGLVSASIELYLALVYQFDTGKLVGEAMITVKVSVLLFSGTVTIRCQRRFASRNGDPSMLDIMGLEPDGSSPEWSRYCMAFAGT